MDGMPGWAAWLEMGALDAGAVQFVSDGDYQHGYDGLLNGVGAS